MKIPRTLRNMRTEAVAGDKQLPRWKVKQATNDFWLCSSTSTFKTYLTCQKHLFMKHFLIWVKCVKETLCSLLKHFDVLLINLQLHGHVFSPSQSSSCEVPLKNSNTTNNKQPTWLNGIQHHASSGNYNKQLATSMAWCNWWKCPQRPGWSHVFK